MEMLKHVIAYAHELIEQVVNPGDTVIDATCGNGNDTLVLSRLVGDEGKVLAFDIQEQAIEMTSKHLTMHDVTNTTLILDSHQRVDHYITPEDEGKLAGAIFNLGYLPGSSKAITTNAESTITAIEKIRHSMKPGGRIVLVVYHGHAEGAIEKEGLLAHVKEYDQKQYAVLQYRFLNQKNNPPFIIAIEKKKKK
ncbi:tRNA (mnm(5)s(2)U34)-methyltransferase [Terribacillus halophilus]|jgi:tRNA A58 N-methylase Trm61|uniref:tRNA (mnm(5)s(2)U34)-methyltransferase n=1 Tax=Terribacillus halophilus TaxID=361279 RepID=UPI0027415969|nr:class I SAM-dependent methyltransferase [Terribacillus halophilus]